MHLSHRLQGWILRRAFACATPAYMLNLGYRLWQLVDAVVGIRVTTCAKIAVQGKKSDGAEFNGAIPED
jgi:hypothetical protein